MTIFGSHVGTPSDATAAEWIAPQLGEFGTVGGCVPNLFERCLLVRHASPDERRQPGHEVELVAQLASVTARHTSTPELVWYAIWEGYGWTSSSTLHAVRRGGPFARLTGAWERRRHRIADRGRAEHVREGLADVPQFDLPSRRYYLVRGPLDSVSRIASPDGFGLQAPDLWWPEDRSWFVASDTDLDWTYVGATEPLAADIANAFLNRTEPVSLSTANLSFSQRS